eukprot:SAG31_NODE_31306_length_369_cov_1.503704_1_plen_32_part_10
MLSAGTYAALADLSAKRKFRCTAGVTPKNSE